MVGAAVHAQADAGTIQPPACAHDLVAQLEEVEDNVPGWMSQFPPSLLKDTVNSLVSQGLLAMIENTFCSI